MISCRSQFKKDIDKSLFTQRKMKVLGTVVSRKESKAAELGIAIFICRKGSHVGKRLDSFSVASTVKTVLKYGRCSK